MCGRGKIEELWLAAGILSVGERRISSFRWQRWKGLGGNGGKVIGVCVGTREEAGWLAFHSVVGGRRHTLCSPLSLLVVGRCVMEEGVA